MENPEPTPYRACKVCVVPQFMPTPGGTVCAACMRLMAHLSRVHREPPPPPRGPRVYRLAPPEHA